MIDWKRIAELRDEIGDDDIGDVIEIFLEEVEETITELGTTVTANEVEQHFHALKGSALNLGFESFAKLCKQGEEESANGNSNPVAKAQVNEVYLASKTEFLEKYDGPSFG